MKVYTNNLGHMSKMTDMLLNGKTPPQIFSKTSGSIAIKFDMKHRRLCSSLFKLGVLFKL